MAKVELTVHSPIRSSQQANDGHPNFCAASTIRQANDALIERVPANLISPERNSRFAASGVREVERCWPPAPVYDDRFTAFLP
jgi:hypothetical protein